MAQDRMIQELTELTLDGVSGGTGHPRIEALAARHENQLARINQGVDTGTMTQQDADELLASEQSLSDLMDSWVGENGGFLTHEQAHDIRAGYRELNSEIFQAKHK